MDNLISRQAAIDYCYELINAENPSDPSDEWNYSQERINQTEVILHHLEVMPPAQPETHEKRTETHACDLISRQAAIEGKICVQRANGVEIYDDYAVPVEYLKQLPPASNSEFPNNSDTISRAKAIESVNSLTYPSSLVDVKRKLADLPPAQPEPDIDDVTCDNCEYSEKYVDGLILCRRAKTSHRVSATSTCGKGKREVKR